VPPFDRFDLEGLGGQCDTPNKGDAGPLRPRNPGSRLREELPTREVSGFARCKIPNLPMANGQSALTNLTDYSSRVVFSIPDPEFLVSPTIWAAAWKTPLVKVG
jgi:hypothetical protein